MCSASPNPPLWRVGVCYFNITNMHSKSPQIAKAVFQHSDPGAVLHNADRSPSTGAKGLATKKPASDKAGRSDATAGIILNQTSGTGVFVGFVEFHVRPELFAQGGGKNSTTTDEIKMRNFIDSGWLYTRNIGMIVSL